MWTPDIAGDEGLPVASGQDPIFVLCCNSASRTRLPGYYSDMKWVSFETLPEHNAHRELAPRVEMPGEALFFARRPVQNFRDLAI
jgi:hypothetical protein